MSALTEIQCGQCGSDDLSVEGTLTGRFSGQVAMRGGALEVVNEMAEYDYEGATVQCHACRHVSPFFTAEEGSDWVPRHAPSGSEQETDE